jgi:hypothetical protein
MRKVIIASLFAMLPVVSVATTTTTQESGYSLTDIALISAGAIAGAVLVDFLVTRMLAAPIESVASSAIAEASAAGAVFGDQIAAATAVKDAKARVDMLYALAVGSGAILGAITLDQIWGWTVPVDAKVPK